MDGEQFEGGKFDAAWRWFINHHLAEAALRLSVLWRVEGDTQYRDAARRILLDYAQHYAAYSRCHRTGDNPGIATYTTLDESVWSISLAWGFSLIAESLPAAEAETIVNDLFVPAAGHLVRRRYPHIHNFTCWHNAAIATLGRVTGRTDLLQIAREGELGQLAQLDRGMLADGLWYEGSMSYHFYSVWAIVMSVLAFRHSPLTDITPHPAIARSLTAPILCAYPDGTLPATNDCWYFTSILGPCCHGVPPAPDLYEIGYALYADPAFAATFGARDSVHALLFGVENVEQAARPNRDSVILQESGLGILRPDADTDLMVKYGQHGAAHGHPDKLSLTGWSHGWRFSPDLGTPGYGVESLESWYRQTLSHNTVLIDGESQPPVTGELRRFENHGRFHIVEVAAEWPGVSLRRTLAASSEYFIDSFEVVCDQPRRIDWIYHNAGCLEALQGLEPVPAIQGGEAYQHLKDVHEGTAAAPLSLRWLDAPHTMAAWIPASDERIATGLSPANPPSEQFGFLLRIRQASRTTFWTVFHPYAGAPRVLDVAWPAGGGVTIHLPDRTDVWGPDLPGEG